MELDTLLLAAIQSSFLLGLLHGVNPCGHSWLVLAPFVTGERNSGRVMLLTCAFLGGTALACLALGASLGAVSQLFPSSIVIWVEAGTSIILIVLGIFLLYDPHFLHHHDNHDNHNHNKHECTNHSHSDESWSLRKKLNQLTTNKKLLPFALFAIGFVNMIIPCPTVAVMYGYAMNAGSTFIATMVFGTYAISTAIAVGGMIFIIFTAASMATSLQKEWVEPFIMRLAGGVIVLFSAYALYHAFDSPIVS